MEFFEIFGRALILKQNTCYIAFNKMILFIVLLKDLDLNELVLKPL